MTLTSQGHSDAFIHGCDPENSLFLKLNSAAGIDANEKPTRPCVVHICVYIYVSKWSYVWASELNEMTCTCVIICVFWVSGSLRSIFTLSLLCPAWRQLENLITGQTRCVDAEKLRPLSCTHKDGRILVTLSRNPTHTSVCPGPPIIHHTHKCAAGHFWFICHTHMTVVQIK